MIDGIDVGREGLMNLEMAPEGFEGVVAYIDGGDRVSQRLLALGIVPGTNIKVLRNSSFGPLIIMAGETKLALGRGVSSKIWLRK